MTQGHFTKEEAQASNRALEEVMKAFSKSKLIDFFCHFNDLFLFIEAAERAAPSEKKEE
jgi:hypothetical protein